jgi:hypothetical protein
VTLVYHRTTTLLLPGGVNLLDQRTTQTLFAGCPFLSRQLATTCTRSGQTLDSESCGLSNYSYVASQAYSLSLVAATNDAAGNNARFVGVYVCVRVRVRQSVCVSQSVCHNLAAMVDLRNTRRKYTSPSPPFHPAHQCGRHVPRLRTRCGASQLPFDPVCEGLGCCVDKWWRMCCCLPRLFSSSRQVLCEAECATEFNAFLINQVSCYSAAADTPPAIAVLLGTCVLFFYLPQGRQAADQLITQLARL